jgi:hypothetical protein
MKTLDRQKLDVTNKTLCHPALRDRRGPFPPELPNSKPIEFDRFGIRADAHSEVNSSEFEGIGNQPN